MKSPTLRRYVNNPLIEPRPGNFWEAGGTFNPAAFALGDKVFLLYRQISRNCVSTFGLAVLSEGREVVERLDEPVYIPRESFEVHPSVAGKYAGPRDMGELECLKRESPIAPEAAASVLKTPEYH
ncbi:MAG: hypothetical protein QW543_05075 [Sulfolobales archaeon]